MNNMEIMQFMEKQALNALRPEHVKCAIKMLSEMGSYRLPTASSISDWVNKRAFPRKAA